MTAPSHTSKTSTTQWSSSACTAACACRPPDVRRHQDWAQHPRGRIVPHARDRGRPTPPTEAFADEMYFCLGCLKRAWRPARRAWTTRSCSSTRAPRPSKAACSSNPKRAPIRRLQGRLAVHGLEATRGSSASPCGSGSDSACKGSCAAAAWWKLMPQRLRELEAMTPRSSPNFPPTSSNPSLPAGEKNYRVAMLDRLRPGPHLQRRQRGHRGRPRAQRLRASPRRSSTAAAPLRAQRRVGTGPAHLARRKPWPNPARPVRREIITNAGGLRLAPQALREAAGGRSGLSRAEPGRESERHPTSGFRADRPAATDSERRASPTTATYHELCHLCHGQKNHCRAAPASAHDPEPPLGRTDGEQLAAQRGHLQHHATWDGRPTPGAKAEAHQIHAGRSRRHGNPGCLLQLINGARQAGLPLRVVHPVTPPGRSTDGPATTKWNCFQISSMPKRSRSEIVSLLTDPASSPWCARSVEQVLPLPRRSSRAASSRLQITLIPCRTRSSPLFAAPGSRSARALVGVGTGADAVVRACLTPARSLSSRPSSGSPNWSRSRTGPIARSCLVRTRRKAQAAHGAGADLSKFFPPTRSVRPTSASCARPAAFAHRAHRRRGGTWRPRRNSSRPAAALRRLALVSAQILRDADWAARHVSPPEFVAVATGTAVKGRQRAIQPGRRASCRRVGVKLPGKDGSPSRRPSLAGASQAPCPPDAGDPDPQAIAKNASPASVPAAPEACTLSHQDPAFPWSLNAGFPAAPNRARPRARWPTLSIVSSTGCAMKGPWLFRVWTQWTNSRPSFVLNLVSTLSAAAKDRVVYEGRRRPGKGKHIVPLSPATRSIVPRRACLNSARFFATSRLHLARSCSRKDADGTVDPNNQTNVPGLSPASGRPGHQSIPVPRIARCRHEALRGLHELRQADRRDPHGHASVQLHLRNKQSPYARFSLRCQRRRLGRPDDRRNVDRTTTAITAPKPRAASWTARTASIQSSAAWTTSRPTDVYGVNAGLSVGREWSWCSQVLKRLKPTDPPNLAKAVMPIVHSDHKGESGKTEASRPPLAPPSICRARTCAGWLWTPAIGSPALEVPNKAGRLPPVGEFNPTYFGGNKFKKGVKVADHELKQGGWTCSTVCARSHDPLGRASLRPSPPSEWGEEPAARAADSHWLVSRISNPEPESETGSAGVPAGESFECEHAGEDASAPRFRPKRLDPYDRSRSRFCTPPACPSTRRAETPLDHRLAGAFLRPALLRSSSSPESPSIPAVRLRQHARKSGATIFVSPADHKPPPQARPSLRRRNRPGSKAHSDAVAPAAFGFGDRERVGAGVRMKTICAPSTTGSRTNSGSGARDRWSPSCRHRQRTENATELPDVKIARPNPWGESSHTRRSSDRDDRAQEWVEPTTAETPASQPRHSSWLRARRLSHARAPSLNITGRGAQTSEVTIAGDRTFREENHLARAPSRERVQQSARRFHGMLGRNFICIYRHLQASRFRHHWMIAASVRGPSERKRNAWNLPLLSARQV